MPAFIEIAWKNIRTQTKLKNKQSNSYNFISKIAESNFTMTLHSKFTSIYSTLRFPEP